MTHELRTPLNAIIGFSEVIQNSSQPKETAGYARYITEAGTRLLGILNGVLDLARIEAGRVEIEDQVVTVDELLRATLRSLRPLADEREIVITCMISDEAVCVDAAKIIQALTIIANAIKFTPQVASSKSLFCWSGLERCWSRSATAAVAASRNGCWKRCLSPLARSKST